MKLKELVDVNCFEEPVWKQTVMIAITARSGSTAICNALSDAGLAKEIGEVLNPRGPFPMYYKRVGGGDIVQYLNGYFLQTQLLGRLIFKTDFSDLQAILKKHRFGDLFPGLKVIYIDRNDKVEQAVSLYRAKLTSVWHRKLGETAKPHVRPDLSNYDFNDIRAEYTRLKQAAANWEDFFETMQLDPERVKYEEFAENPQSVLLRLGRFIADLDITEKFEIRQLKIGDEINIQWAQMFRRDLGVNLGTVEKLG